MFFSSLKCSKSKQVFSAFLLKWSSIILCASFILSRILCRFCQYWLSKNMSKLFILSKETMLANKTANSNVFLHYMALVVNFAWNIIFFSLPSCPYLFSTVCVGAFYLSRYMFFLGVSYSNYF